MPHRIEARALAKKSHSNSTTLASSPMDVDLLERLTRLMKENDLNTVDVRDGDKRVILKRGPAFAAPATMQSAPAFAPGVALAASGSSASASPAATDEAAGLHAIKSPMVGTFYAAAS